MSETARADPRYQVQRTCAICGGDGNLMLAACPDCGQPVAAKTIAYQDDALPCGHAIAAVFSICDACGGQGAITHILTEEEYQQLRRKRIIRGILLLILALIPLILLLIAIIMREPDLRFGVPWY